jgi:hypothetical protein
MARRASRASAIAQLLAEAGYPKGFDAVELATDVTFAPESEAVIT